MEILDKLHKIRAIFGGSRAGLESGIMALAGNMGEALFRDEAAGILADIIDRAKILPDAYRSYRPMVQDGILFFISKLPLKRLAGLLAHQVSMDENVDAGKRLVEFAKQVPTFQKLGQMIARNRHMDPRVRDWLVQLENGSCETDAEDLCRMIEETLGPDQERFRIRMDRTLLSEASVGAVLPFTWKEQESGLEREGVFKALKPEIDVRLEEEMAALDLLTEYFEERRHLYPFGEFRFRELFEDVKAALREELDLSGEQANLLLANQFYKKNKEILVPTPTAFSSRHFTAMSRVDGTKVNDALVLPEDRKQAAEIIFRAIVCRPLFSSEDFPIFHGDPHAGNIFSAGREDSGTLRIALLDWSQTGRLAKRWRVSILKFIQGVIRDDEETICRALDAFTVESPESARNAEVSRAVGKVISLPEYRKASLIKKVFIMMERLSFHGVRFHKDLLLFRKSFFTLDGLLHDLDPDFNMDHAVMAYIRDLLIAELPRRIAALLIPISDAPEKYRSLLSNKDLQMLLLCHAVEFIRKNTHVIREFMEKHTGTINALFCLPKIFSSRTAKVLLGLYYLYRMRDAAAEA